MNDFTLFDTDILIDFIHGSQEALNCLQSLESVSALSISAVTQMELIVGCRNKRELQALTLFLKRFQKVSLSEEISNRAIGLLSLYTLSHGLQLADSLIAATALTLDTPFISKNQRDYKYIPSLNLLSYP